MKSNCAFDVGWGRLIFGQTFDNLSDLVATLREEGPDRRDIAVYIDEPHVLLSHAPQEVFLDPSHTFRLNLADYRPSERPLAGFVIRPLASGADADAINRIYASRAMVTVPLQFFQSERSPDPITYLVAEDETTGRVVGTVTGVDHGLAFDDPARGASLWCLAVDPQARQPGIGEALVRSLAEHFAARGAAFLDLSVMHDNNQAIALYEKLGFERVTFFTVKRKNPINEKLFAGPEQNEGYNPYAQIIINEARRRGIMVEPINPGNGFFRLSFGARSVRCRESLSELTSAVAMSICDDKAITRRIVAEAGVRVPEQLTTGVPMEEIAAFLKRHGRLVVKPARGEQGRGISVGVTSLDQLDAAVVEARKVASDVLVEQCVEGEDLRLVVINFRVVAAAIRRPATVVGDGSSTVLELIEAQSRRRAAATGGESRIPADGETERTVHDAGMAMDSVLPAGEELRVRRTANLHTGGTIHDVTDMVHPLLVEAGIKVARAIDIPVVGVDLMVKSPMEPDYAFIEANERPGLANHEPQPTAERFIDLLFPLAIPAGVRQVMEAPQARGDA
ncbi:N-acetylglutaminylglutamine synthetase [Ancylobacter dichloromethanicus]|uniref:GNAT family N-acetyltransferase n=1 Tax=Ancylobacter dichloromethanicus TaxID=518825 RepID=A0A9W6JCW4_9HYPH|nr:N-acetylglutaminylglutamine synthetase [Ancylobacter dichloromethanicus]MBS7556654.1 N-acetylglutaminylglutamine synthetase [Ancylobacter dichloromethanicus]GLK73505.1 GNAT family N-acetyltransferase [Ancylobacter dichloromethanicus]